jgi:hypothetical protein
MERAGSGFIDSVRRFKPVDSTTVTTRCRNLRQPGKIFCWQDGLETIAIHFQGYRSMDCRNRNHHLASIVVLGNDPFKTGEWTASHSHPRTSFYKRMRFQTGSGYAPPHRVNFRIQDRQKGPIRRQYSNHARRLQNRHSIGHENPREYIARKERGLKPYGPVLPPAFHAGHGQERLDTLVFQLVGNCPFMPRVRINGVPAQKASSRRSDNARFKHAAKKSKFPS